jgi:hypothetical protein
MAETFTKADVERLVADAIKLAQSEHAKQVEELKRASAKTESQKEHENNRDAHRAKQAAMRAKARELQGANARMLKYVVGPGQAYCAGRHYKPGEIIEKLNNDDPLNLPALDYAVYDSGAPKPPPEKKGPLTSAEMNKADAERPKHGVVAAKKGSRPSDIEV